MISDHLDKNQRHFSSNTHPVRSNLVHDMVSFWRWQCANSEYAFGYMGLCRILWDTHAPCAQAKDYSNKAHNFLFGITHTITFIGQVVITCCLNAACSFNLVYFLEVGQQAQCSTLLVYTTAKEMVHLCQTLIEMGWPQPCTPNQTDISTVIGITNLTIVPKETKFMDLHLWWL